MRTAAIFGILLPLLLATGCDPFGTRAVQERKRARTAEAPVTIVRTGLVVQHDPDDVRPDTLHSVVWRFEADGRTHTDSIPATRYVASEAYKVCYDPADPANSSIQLADIACSRSP